MSDTAISTAGKTAGIVHEVNGNLTKRDRDAVRRALAHGFEVPLEGLHPEGFFADSSVIIRRKEHPDVEGAGIAYRRRLWKVKYGTGWLKRIQSSTGIELLPDAGERAVEVATVLATVVGWPGPLEDSDDEVVDLSKMDGEAVRQFLRAHYLQEWQVWPGKQPSLPPYDADDVDTGFLQMLKYAESVLDANPTEVLLHLKGDQSSTPFKVTHAEILESGDPGSN